MTNESIQALKIQALFENKQTYIIPMYQRNYAWVNFREKEIDQLILDIQDYQKQPEQLNQGQTLKGSKNIILEHWLFLSVAMALMKLSMVSNDLPL